MADDAPTQAIVSDNKPEESSTAVAATDATQNKDSLGSITNQAGDDARDTDSAAKDSVSQHDVNGASAPTTTDDTTNDAAESADIATHPETDANGTADPSKKTAKRKSIAGGSDHTKAKGTPKGKGKKPAPQLHLDAEPGQLWFAHMRGHQPWPAVICDEEMLPESLLSKRPVSAKRVDGTYREDFNEGGKNARDRRYPIMFLGTNEFAWQVNTDLQPLDIEEVKKAWAAEDRGKKSQALWDAYGVAEKDHDLAWFKNMLSEHEAAMRADAEEREQKAAEKEAKKDKKARRKSEKVDEDVDMEDVDTPDVKKSASKKRKKEQDEDDVDTPKPRTKLKVNGPKTPSDASAKPKSAKKAKKAAKTSDDEETPVSDEKPVTEAERRQKREKTVLYLRHRLQKGFLNRETEPKEEEMQAMSGHFNQLEQYHDLEPEIIKATKIHKVLKGIVRLNSIPKDEELNFKKRSNDLLSIWNKTLAAEAGTPATADAPNAATNGVAKEDKPESKPAVAATKDESPAASKEPASGEADKSEAAKINENGDVSMTDAKEASASVDPVKDESSKVLPSTEASDAPAVAT